MSNIFTYFTVSLPFSSRDVSAISNLLQTTITGWQHVCHSTQMYHFGAAEKHWKKSQLS